MVKSSRHHYRFDRSFAGPQRRALGHSFIDLIEGLPMFIQTEGDAPTMLRHTSFATGRRLLAAPPSTCLRAEVGELLDRLAHLHSELEDARAQLTAALADSDEASRSYQRHLPDAIASAFSADSSEFAQEAQLRQRRSHSRLLASLQRLHVKKLEQEIREMMDRIAELSDAESSLVHPTIA